MSSARRHWGLRESPQDQRGAVHREQATKPVAKPAECYALAEPSRRESASSHGDAAMPGTDSTPSLPRAIHFLPNLTTGELRVHEAGRSIEESA